MGPKKEITPISTNDKEFFEQFYGEYKNFMFFSARKYVNTQSECEDIVQDTVERLLHNVNTIKQIDSCRIRKYIALTVRAAFLDSEKKKQKSCPFSFDDAILEELLKADLVYIDNYSDLYSRMEVEKIRNELPARDWIVLEGKYIMGYSQEELGSMLGVAPDSIRMIICRAKQKARLILFANQKSGGRS